MGQLCSRPRTVEDKPPGDAVSVRAEPGHKERTSPVLTSHHLVDGSAHHSPLERQDSDAEPSELDLVVQQLHNNPNSVTGSAPELLRQWDHDHRVVLQSIDASIQV